MEKEKKAQGLPPLASRILRPLGMGMLLLSTILTLLAAWAVYPAARAEDKIWHLILLTAVIFTLSAVCMILLLHHVAKKYLEPLSKAVNEITLAASGDLTGPADPIPCTTYEVEALLRALGDLSEQNTACLSKMEDTIAQIASGDFTAQVDCLRALECGGVCAALDGAVDRLRGAIGSVRTALEQITGPLDVLEQDAAYLEESAAGQQQTRDALLRSLEGLNKQISCRSDGMQTVSNDIRALRIRLDEYTHRQEELSQAIGHITECAGAAREIVRAMESASFQCSVLARTAYVEAAGAGINGKGFAVVASELRMLASRSAQSAQDAAAFMEEMERTIRESAALAAAAVREANRLTDSADGICRSADDAAQNAGQMENLRSTVRQAAELDGLAEKDLAKAGNAARTARLVKQRVGRLREALRAFKIN